MKPRPSIGLIGLGTMGSNLALNIAENGHDIAVYNRTVSRTHSFITEAGPLAEKITGCDDVEQFVGAMQSPRKIILMVPAGPVVDQQIDALKPYLAPDDIIIDAGNANFKDTNRRAQISQESGYKFLGIGVSGGEQGARFGPSIMGGGSPEAWAEVEPVLKSISAQYGQEPCCAWMGVGGAGHFVKMVHNGIEYADMQMIAEVYGILRDGMGMSAPEIGAVFAKWNEGPLKSYLIEISAIVSNCIDQSKNIPILDVILDKAGQKGTGRWTAIEAQHLGTPVTVIEAAVAARNLSSRLEMRQDGEKLFGSSPSKMDPQIMTLDTLEAALLAGKIACYAQGFDMLVAASDLYKWNLPMPDVAKVWREGCIIRSDMLSEMAKSLESSAGTNLMFSAYFSDLMRSCHGDLRKVVGNAALCGNPAPALGAGLNYFDMMRTARSTANMLQAQRDYFGAHTFERIGETGHHNGPWNGTNS